MNEDVGLVRKVGAPVWIIVIFAVALSFFLGFQSGKTKGVRSIVPEGEAKVVNTGTNEAEDIDFGLFWDVWNTIKDDYVDQPVSEEDLFYGALHGLVEGLGDDYSSFFTQDENEEFNAEIDGTFSGIGAEINEEDDYIIVVSPLKDSPAQNAGVQAGDYILAVDGASTYQMSVFEAVSIIRGEKGSNVTLTLSRDGGEAFDVTITRDDITIDSVEWEMRSDNIMVISIYMFNHDTTRLFTEAIQEASTQNLDGLVIDLRNNPGGLLSEAINVAGFWTGDKTVVVQDMRGNERPLSSGRQPVLEGVPTAVLINGGSASASEILAGALQDHGLGYVIGEQSFGKGSVQELRDFTNGAALKLTVAKWLTPNRRSIQGEGIAPDEVVEFTEEDLNAEATPQLEAAIRYLKAR